MEHVEEVPLPPHIVVESVVDKEDERLLEATLGEGEETMDIQFEREEMSDNKGDAAISDVDDEAPMADEVAKSDEVSDLSHWSEEVRNTDNDDTDLCIIGTNNAEVEVMHTTPDKVVVNEVAENLVGRGTTS